MPTYNYRCENCKREIEELRKINAREFPGVCTKCGGATERIFKFTTNRDWFRSHINEDITGTPIEITSKKQYRRLCEENGVMARCLL